MGERVLCVVVDAGSLRAISRVISASYDPSNPQPSHFTQMVWKATTNLRCAVMSCSGVFPASFGPAEYYVCEYRPEGNVIGAFPYVLPRLFETHH
jgi:hypothetical protein